MLIAILCASVDADYSDSSASVDACWTSPPLTADYNIKEPAHGGEQLRARLASERGQSVQKDGEILLLKTHLANAQAEAESSRSYVQKLAEEKMALLVKAEQERSLPPTTAPAAYAAEYKASCH
ncbi:hypothetical protein Tco_1107556 [Tanacetum coccineum]